MAFDNKLIVVFFVVLFRFKGFLQVYQLQTENDEEETWRDLVCIIYFFDR
jgi:hypothetical protein